MGLRLDTRSICDHFYRVQKTSGNCSGAKAYIDDHVSIASFMSSYSVMKMQAGCSSSDFNAWIIMAAS